MIKNAKTRSITTLAKWIENDNNKIKDVVGIRKRRKNVYKSLAAILLIVLFLIWNGTIEIGIRGYSIETDTRNSANIENSWNVSKETADAMSAMIFYAEDLEDYRFSIYVNRPGLSLGWFFRSGGSLPEIEESIAEISIEDYEESAFVSMNKQQVCKVVIEDDKSTTTWNLDSEKPFSYVIPNRNTSVTFYDVNGKVIESTPC
ncbi:MAG: hypothetical protein Q4G58_16650 [bacterium]|nr:hypothetical protein [bacterium]